MSQKDEENEEFSKILETVCHVVNEEIHNNEEYLKEIAIAIGHGGDFLVRLFSPCFCARKCSIIKS